MTDIKFENKWPKTKNWHTFNKYITHNNCLTFQVTEKLHGMNASITFTRSMPSLTTFSIQSRNNVIYKDDVNLTADKSNPKQKNAMVSFFLDNLDLFKHWVNNITINHFHSPLTKIKEVTIFGEFCNSKLGKHTWCTQLKSNIFVGFGYSILYSDDSIVYCLDLSDNPVPKPSDQIFTATVLGEVKVEAFNPLDITKSLEDIEKAFQYYIEQLEHTGSVFARKHFGIEGASEGIVCTTQKFYTPVENITNSCLLKFKTPSYLEQNKVKLRIRKPPVDTPPEIVSYFEEHCSPERLESAFNSVMGTEPCHSKIKSFLDYMWLDIETECGVPEHKTSRKTCDTLCRTWVLEKLNTK